MADLGWGEGVKNKNKNLDNMLATVVLLDVASNIQHQATPSIPIDRIHNILYRGDLRENLLRVYGHGGCLFDVSYPG